MAISSAMNLYSIIFTLRLMGKFAGSNRKMLADLQQLSYNDDGYILEKPALQLTFHRMRTTEVGSQDEVRSSFFFRRF